MSKQNKEIKQEIKFEYEIGSNVICVNGMTQYLSVVLWDKDLSYEEIKQYIVK